MKTIIHYTNGSSYTYPKLTVDGWVDWDKSQCILIDPDSEFFSKATKVYLPEDTLCIEVRDLEGGYYSVWTNPKYEYSVNMDVMTAKARSKANRKELYEVIGF